MTDWDDNTAVVFGALDSITTAVRHVASRATKKTLVTFATAAVVVPASGACITLPAYDGSSPPLEVRVEVRTAASTAAELANVRIEQSSVLPATSRDDLPMVLAEISLAKLHTLAISTSSPADLDEHIEQAERLVDLETERLVARIRARPRNDVDVTLDAAVAILDGRPVPDDAYRILAARRPLAKRRSRKKT